MSTFERIMRKVKWEKGKEWWREGDYTTVFRHCRSANGFRAQFVYSKKQEEQFRPTNRWTPGVVAGLTRFGKSGDWGTRLCYRLSV